MGAAETYHRVTFEHVEEAAAFIAALSRFVASPAGSTDDRSDATETSIEVAAVILPGSQHLDVYLNDAALAATIRGFGPPVVVATCRALEVPSWRLVVLGPNDRGAYGSDEIARRIATALPGSERLALQ